MENIVFLHLRRKHKDLYYWKDEQEVDFIVPVNKDQTLIINVSAHIHNKATRDRELQGLISCMDTLRQDEGVLVTMFHEEDVRLGNKTLRIIPVWKWLLEDLEGLY